MPNYKKMIETYTGGDFDVTGGSRPSVKLNSLLDCPKHITGRFICEHNYLTSLVGGPQHVDNNYWCGYNQITDLVGCASHIGGELNICYNSITSLVGIHKIIKSCPDIFFDTSEIKEGGIGLLLIENLTWISSASTPFEIIKKYLGSGTKGMMECRSELIANRYANYAKL